MEKRAEELAAALRALLEQKGHEFSAWADSQMPFDRPSPQMAYQSGMEVRQAAVALAVFPRDKQWQLALMKRTEYPGVHSGQISIPGGERDATDLDFQHTAVREFQEEMGVLLDRDALVPGLSDRFIPPSGFSVRTYVAVLAEEPDWNPDPKEVAEVLVIPVDQLTQHGALVPTPVTIRKGVRVELPAYPWNGEVIWGATAIILTEFAAAWRQIFPRA